MAIRPFEMLIGAYRHGVTSRKTWIFSNTAVRNSTVMSNSVHHFNLMSIFYELFIHPDDKKSLVKLRGLYSSPNTQIMRRARQVACIEVTRNIYGVVVGIHEWRKTPGGPTHEGNLISSPVIGLEWPRGFQEVKVPKLHDNGTGWW